MIRLMGPCISYKGKSMNSLKELLTSLDTTENEEAQEELSELDTNTQCICQCTCGGKANMHKGEHDNRLIQFLMGLNDVYAMVRGSILMMNPLSKLAQAFSILAREVKQSEVSPHNHFTLESTS